MRYARLFCGLILFAAVIKPSAVHNLTPISGAGATVPITTSSCAVRADWIQVLAPSGNSAVVWFGDSTTSGSSGLPIAAGGGYNTPVVPGSPYNLCNHYVYVANGDTAYVAYGN